MNPTIMVVLEKRISDATEIIEELREMAIESKDCGTVSIDKRIRDATKYWVEERRDAEVQYEAIREHDRRARFGKMKRLEHIEQLIKNERRGSP